MTANNEKDRVTAGVLLIGDELLSGRTKDKNFGYLAELMTELGIEMCEARIVSDVEDEIVTAVRALSKAYDYVFTTGGIGPTHDDITADAMARAFNVELFFDQGVMDAMSTSLSARGLELTEARKRMARFPEGASLVKNAANGPPGFQIENVFVLAGVPSICQAMMEDVIPRLRTGKKMLSRTVPCTIGEGDIGDALSALQDIHSDVSIGSYPYFTPTGFGTNLVIRSTDEPALEAAERDVTALVKKLGG